MELFREISFIIKFCSCTFCANLAFENILAFKLLIRVGLEFRKKISLLVLEFVRVSEEGLEGFKRSTFVMVNNCLSSQGNFDLEFVIIFLFLVDLKVFSYGLDRLHLKEFTKFELFNYLFKIVFYLRCLIQLVIDLFCSNFLFLSNFHIEDWEGFN